MTRETKAGVVTEVDYAFGHSFGPLTPSISATHARIADEGPPEFNSYSTWFDVIARTTVATRNERTVADVILAGAVMDIDPDYDADPLDAVKVRGQVDEWTSPIDRPGYPHVHISDRYKFGLRVAERMLAYQADGTRWDDAVILLAVEFDMDTEQEVRDVLAWMGVERPPVVIKRPAHCHDLRRSTADHGEMRMYQRGCRCPDCRLAARLHRIEKLGLDPDKVRVYGNARYASGK